MIHFKKNLDTLNFIVVLWKKNMKTILSILLISLTITATTVQGQTRGRISVSGNSFVDENGKTIIFKGVNIADPDTLLKKGHWSKEIFEEAKDWGANIIRLPIHPGPWRKRGAEGYTKLLDQAVTWAKELDLYLIIDWHSIGNLRTELYMTPMYNTTRKETYEFWLTISRKYANEPVIAFYELYNEPTSFVGQLGPLTWPQWKEILTDMITIVKSNSPKTIPLVAGFNWAYDLSVMKGDLLDIEGIAYVAHPYPQKRNQPWEPQWEEDWGFMADHAPVILTEIGFAMTEEEGVHMPVKGDEEYGKRITDYAASKGISWVFWVFDEDWEPMMFYDWNYTPTRQGKFFKELMKKENSK